MNHHPDHDWLERYAAGLLPLPLALCLGGHIESCADCRPQVAVLQQLAAALFTGLAPAPVAPPLRERVLAAIKAAPERTEPTTATPATAEVPAALQAWAPAGLDRLRWARALPGLSRVRLPGEGGYRVTLVRLAAGGAVPAHDHRGLEMTLLLRGGFSDSFGRFDAGDLVVRQPGQPHHPRADEECICLVVEAAPVRFTGPLRLLNPLLR